MSAVYGEEGRLKKNMSIRCENIDIGHGQELFLQV
jgi:hypothetical protein